MGVDQPSGDGTVEIRRAAERFATYRDGITSRHCFSFGPHYDPSRVGVRTLVALNEETLAPGAGFDTHLHRDLDIVTWVLEGAMHHEDSLGSSVTVRPGTLQRLTAGTGVTHSETNVGTTGKPLRFVQLWFTLDADAAPAYESWAIGDQEKTSTIRLGVPKVDVSLCCLPVGAAYAIEGGGPQHAETFTYLAEGAVRMAEGVLRAGDAVRSSADDVAATVVEAARAIAVRFRWSAQGR